jgi:hypothetical protein
LVRLRGGSPRSAAQLIIGVKTLRRLTDFQSENTLESLNCGAPMLASCAKSVWGALREWSRAVHGAG